jgi:ABC-type phosphate transport system substrate-binding protein
MSIYDYDAMTGSDIGLQAASCRTDAFWGVDGPYTQATLTALDGAPGSLDCSPFAALAPPYAPRPAPYPASADTAGPVLTIPVAGTSVAIGVNLQASDCGGTKPSSLQFSTSMISRLLGGDIMRWNDPALRAGGLNASLVNCNRQVTRVVRLDSASTTQVLKNYLVHADNNRSTSTTCFFGGAWSTYANPQFNTYWPSDNGTFCSPLATAASPGDTAQLATCVATPGAICYADLPVMVGQSSLIRPALRNATDTGYAPPSSVSTANCSFTTLLAPSGGTGGAVGLNTSDTWATDNPSGNHGDVTFMGAGYPICELTYVLAYAGLHAGGTAVSRLDFDQRQTLYSYLVYTLSDPGQSKLLTSFFQKLPTSLAATLRGGVQANL